MDGWGEEMGLTDSTATVTDVRGEWPRRRNELVPSVEPGRPTRIVCIGGGTGLPMVLRGLARRAAPRDGEPGLDITAVVTMSDDGGSSGRLRRSLGVLPPGDVRNCLVALARKKNPVSDLFQYRFGRSRGLTGHALGNLLLAALTELRGDFLEAVRHAEVLLGTRGRVLPCTLSPVELVAETDGAGVVVGERFLARGTRRVRRVSLAPRAPPPCEGILEAIASADLVAIGPGSLYSSVLPNLLVQGVAEALMRTRAPKVLVMNLMTQPGETDQMGCVEHVRAVQEHVGNVIDVALVNVARPPPEVMARYQRKGAQPVEVDRRALIDAGVVPFEADLLKAGERVRHDSGKVARCLVRLARSGI